MALRWADVDLERHTLRVRGTLSGVDGRLTVTELKTARSRRFVPLTVSAPAEQLLSAVHAAQDAQRRRAGSAWRGTGFVLTTEFGEPCDSRNAFRAFRVAATRAASLMPGCTPAAARRPA